MYSTSTLAKRSYLMQRWSRWKRSCRSAKTRCVFPPGTTRPVASTLFRWGCGCEIGGDRWLNCGDEHKKPSDGKSLIERIDYFGGLTAQFEWMRADNRQIRIAYTTSGRPTAAPLLNHQAVTDSRVYWIPCESDSESNYLMAVINSHSLYSAVSGFMSAGQFGPRDLHKHLWRLPIPRFNPTDQLHGEIAGAGARAAVGVEEILADLHGANKKVTVAIARREIRNWLTKSADGPDCLSH